MILYPRWFRLFFMAQINDEYLIHALEYHCFLLDEIYLKTGKLSRYVKIFDLEGAMLKVREYL
jgi:hypothetical protein